ncbi:hypothetical protein UlMin_008420 [Ulmus minor]
MSLSLILSSDFYFSSRKNIKLDISVVPQVDVVHHQDLNKRILIALIMASTILGGLMLFLSCFWIYRWRKFRNFNGKNQKKMEAAKGISSSPLMVRFNSLRMGNKKASVAIFEYQLWFIHQNIVKLLGHCINSKTRLLVYEMMQNESLETQSSRVWHLRLRIVVDHCNPSIIHRNLTLSNILLDSKSSAKGISTHKHVRLAKNYVKSSLMMDIGFEGNSSYLIVGSWTFTHLITYGVVPIEQMLLWLVIFCFNRMYIICNIIDKKRLIAYCKIYCNTIHVFVRHFLCYLSYTIRGEMLNLEKCLLYIFCKTVYVLSYDIP